MKAAVLHEAGGIPRYEGLPDLVAGDGELITDVTAIAVESVDKAIAAGTPYASEKHIGRLPVIPTLGTSGPPGPGRG
jgi:NADPH2:quinone reductase